MRASDIRRQAWTSLTGRWGIAIIAGIVATLLGVTTAFIPVFPFNFRVSFNINNSSDASGIPNDAVWAIFAAIVLVLFVAVILIFIYLAAIFCIGSVIRIGYARFNLNIIDFNEIKFVQLFSYFKHWWRAMLANFLSQLFIFLWSLLFIIPGIIASYRYSMVPYILAENPDMSPKDAISLSKVLMIGNKWRLFCLNLSFIGWDILCVLTLGVLYIWVSPYKHAALAAFYRSIIPANRENDACNDFIK